MSQFPLSHLVRPAVAPAGHDPDLAPAGAAGLVQLQHAEGEVRPRLAGRRVARRPLRQQGHPGGRGSRRRRQQRQQQRPAESDAARTRRHHSQSRPRRDGSTAITAHAPPTDHVTAGPATRRPEHGDVTSGERQSEAGSG